MMQTTIEDEFARLRRAINERDSLEKNCEAEYGPLLRKRYAELNIPSRREYREYVWNQVEEEVRQITSTHAGLDRDCA